MKWGLCGSSSFYLNWTVMALKSDCIGVCNRSKMLTAARWWFSLEAQGLDDSCGISEEVDFPPQSPHTARTRRPLHKWGNTWQTGCVHLQDLKFFLTPKGLLVPKNFPNNVHVPTIVFQLIRVYWKCVDDSGNWSTGVCANGNQCVDLECTFK